MVVSATDHRVHCRERGADVLVVARGRHKVALPDGVLVYSCDGHSWELQGVCSGSTGQCVWQ